VTYTATVSPVPDGGTVAFNGLGAPSGCSAVPVNTTTGKATCQATYTQVNGYLLQAVYSGDANLYPSVSFYLLQLVASPPTTSRASVSGSSLTMTVGCTSSCSVTLTAPEPLAGGASAARFTAGKRKKPGTKTITLGTGHFRLRGKGSEKLTIRLTKAAKTYLRAHHDRVKAPVLISEKTTTGALRTTRTIKITPAKTKKK
jgi:hypothetical protein